MLLLPSSSSLLHSMALITVDLSMCGLMVVGLRLTLGWAIAFAVLCRVCIIALNVQYWFIAVCAMFGGFALLVGGGLSEALYPVQSTRDAVLQTLRLRDAAAKAAERRRLRSRLATSQSQAKHKDVVTVYVAPDGRVGADRPAPRADSEAARCGCVVT